MFAAVFRFEQRIRQHHQVIHRIRRNAHIAEVIASPDQFLVVGNLRKRRALIVRAE